MKTELVRLERASREKSAPSRNKPEGNKLERKIVVNCLEDTQYVLLVSDFSADEKYNLAFQFERAGIDVDVLGLFSLKQDEALTLKISVEHKVKDTSCSVKIRSVLSDSAHMKTVGKVMVAKSAALTESEFSHKTLVTGTKTKNTSSPMLMIDTNDVVCSHSSTTSQVDDEELYYLMSRGLSEQESVDVVKTGFFEDLLRTINDERIRNEILAGLI